VTAPDTALQWLSAVTSHHPFWRRALYLLVKLSSQNRQFPSSLFVQGVDIGFSRDPVCQGGFGDIFIGKLRGAKVAVKRLRLDNQPELHNVSTTQMFRSIAYGGELYQRIYREALVWSQLNHPRVLPLLGIDRDTFCDTQFIGLVAPWMDHGNLRRYRNEPIYNPNQDISRIVCFSIVYVSSLITIMFSAT
jgi:serine/threonine protein kinase